VWKDVIGFEDLYQINEHGEIKNKEDGSLLKYYISGSGYKFYKFLGDRTKSHYAHVLVATHFIPNIHSKPEVNHIDHDKLNCHVDNLEWVTRKENMEKSAVFYGGRIEGTCEYCNNKFMFKKSEELRFCSMKCYNLSTRLIERPSKEELLELVKSKPFTKIGEMFGVSDNAIRKWCEDYGLPRTKKELRKL